MSEKDGGSAFPVESTFIEPMGGAIRWKPSQGMTLRDYFAAQLIDGASRDLVEPEDIARRAYSVADAMIARRAK